MYRLEDVLWIFDLSLSHIGFGGCLAHLGYHVHQTGHKITTFENSFYLSYLSYNNNIAKIAVILFGLAASNEVDAYGL